MFNTCPNYCGVTCVNGHCPNALSNENDARDDDALECYRLEKPITCSDCFYNKGCEDCAFSGNCIGETLVKEKDNENHT